MRKLLLTFISTHQALKAEKIFKSHNIKVELIPTPREISSECGFALMIYIKDEQDLTKLKNEITIKFENSYTLSEHQGEKRYEKTD